MIRLLRKLPLSVVGTVLGLLFFFLYYLYLWLVVDLRLIYHGGGIILDFPVFYRGWEFFRQSVSCPGGLVGYIGAFLAQFFCIGWIGALIVTVQAWLLWLCTRAIVRTATGRQLGLLCFIPPILMLLFYERYIYTFGVVMDLLVTLGFVYVYMRAASKKKPADLLVFLVLSIILYLTTGGAYLLFAATCAVYELLLRRRAIPGIIFLLAGPIIVYGISVSVLNISIIDAFRDFMPGPTKASHSS